MVIGNYDIEQIYRAMYGIAKKCVSKVFTSDRPSSTDTALASFIVVSLPTSITNELALGFTTAKFQIFVKDTTAGLENISGISSIKKALYGQLPVTIDNKWNFTDPMFLQIGSDGKGFHVYSITTSLTIL